jgi:hypothetical protein
LILCRFSFIGICAYRSDYEFELEQAVMRTIYSKFDKLKLFLICLAMVLVAFGPARAAEHAATGTFVVIGTATVQGANIAVARETAIADSLVTAVAVVAQELLQEASLVDNFNQINELLFDQTSKFVQDYKVLTEAANENSYRVVVQTTVSREKISKQLSDAGILKVKTTMPSILLLIAEQNLGELRPRFWWNPKESGFVSVVASVMAERLKDAGFAIIDPMGALNRTQVNRGAFDKPELTNQEAAELGTLLQADVVILGTAAASPSTNIMGSAMRSFNGTVTGRIIRSKSADQISNFTRTAVAVNEDDILGSQEALESAGDMAGKALAEELAVLWQRQAGRPAVVEMVIRGTSDLASYVKFRKTLNTIAGVEGIRVKEIKPNEALLLVEYKGKTEDLAAALMQQNFESFGINIFEVTQDAVRVELIPG